MRLMRVGLVGFVCLTAFAAPVGEGMPANTVRLSAMMQELSARPGFTEAFLKQVEGGAKKNGAALLTPELVDLLRKRILGKDWRGLDTFPGWTMGEINPTVRVVGHVAGKDEKVNGMATAGGAPAGTAGAPNTAYLQMGEFGLGNVGTESLDVAAKGKGFEAAEFVTSLGDGVTRGDGASELAPLHAESTRLAEVLNRLSLNAELAEGKRFHARLGGAVVSAPEELVRALLASGHAVEVSDSRFFANFGHLHYKGQDVMMPFWVDSQVVVPGTKRDLLVPVSHAEYEWEVRGPRVNAAVSFYFGIDGRAEWRTMDQQDQAWVMKRHAHEYAGGDAVEVTRLAAEIVRAYGHLHAAHPAIPFGGYYGFGVCQDVVAAIELKMTGKATLFPNTADESFFTDARDAEVNGLIRRLPKDRNGRPPEVERIFGSLPVGESDAELRTVSIPGLGGDLVAVHDAWTAGKVRRTATGWRRWVRFSPAALLVLLLLVSGLVLRRKRREAV